MNWRNSGTVPSRPLRNECTSYSVGSCSSLRDLGRRFAAWSHCCRANTRSTTTTLAPCSPRETLRKHSVTSLGKPAIIHCALSPSSFVLTHCSVVVDIQGVRDVWTDPQIHTADHKGFGIGNAGPKGINKFFTSHVCSSICRGMRLPPCGEQSAPQRPSQPQHQLQPLPQPQHQPHQPVRPRPQELVPSAPKPIPGQKDLYAVSASGHVTPDTLPRSMDNGGASLDGYMWSGDWWGGEPNEEEIIV